jgi:peptidoglycan-associated lipoprotein
MSRQRLWLVGGLASLVLAACNSSPPVPAGGAGGALGGANGGGPGGGAATAGDVRGGQIGASELDLPQDLLDDLVVYFEFDSSEIRSEFNNMLAAHGQYLSSNPNVQVRLEGHADERGSREYNIGLGERRALAVRQILLLQGAAASQLSTVSYGEERPAVFGSDEEAYRLNRRVEIVYQ